MIYNNKIKLFICCFAVLAVSFICRMNVLNNLFVLDDFRLVISNLFIQNFENLKEVLNPKNLFYVLPIRCGARPLAVASLIVDYSFYGNNPFGYHLFNLILHCANSLLVFLFVFFLNNKRNFFCALAACLFFSVHPIQSEAVSVISFRADLVFVFFYLLALNLTNLLQYNDKRRNLIYSFIFLAICFSFFTKENAVVIPLAVLLSSVFFYNNNKLKKFSAVTLVFIISMFLFFWITRFPVPLYFTIYPNLYGNIIPLANIPYYFNTILTSLFFNAVHIIYPVKLSVDYTLNFSPIITVSALFFIIGTLYLFLFKIKDKYIKLSLILIVIPYLPVSNIIPLVNTVADRYMYMPMVGVSLLFACLLQKTMRSMNKKFLIYFFITGLFLIYGLLSYQRGQAYNNPYTLYSDAILKSPENIRTIYNMGVSNFSNGKYEQAIINFNKAEQINPLYLRDRIWLLTAMTYDALEDKQQARKYYYKAFLLNPLHEEIVEKFILSFDSFEQAKNYVLQKTVRLNDNIYLALKKYSQGIKDLE